MSGPISRRKLLTTGLVVAGAAGVAAATRIAGRYVPIPPDHRGLYGIGETLTYASQRWLTAHSSAREFSRADISRVAPVNGEPPKTDEYQRQLAAGFADWRLTVDGLVARPASFALADLQGFPARSQITHQACEEGWSFIAEWTGVPVSYVLDLVGVRPEARYVAFFAFDKKYDSIDMADAWHRQSLLAYAMNGQELPTRHGAPLRLRIPRQLGFKSKKYLVRMSVTDTMKNIGNGQGANGLDHGYAWYGGI